MSCTIGSLLEWRRVSSGRVSATQGTQEVTYGELLGLVLGACQKLRGAGIYRGATVAVCVADELEHFVVSLALLVSGARQITLSLHESPDVTRRLAQLVAPSFAISDGRQVDFVPSIVGTNTLTCSPMSEIETGEAIQSLGLVSGSNQPGSLLLRTSGTTGGLNIVELSEFDLLLQARRHPEYRDERLMRFASIEHNNSKRHRLYVFYQGGCNIFRGGQSDNWLDYISSGTVTALDISRMHAQDLLSRFKNGELRNVKVRTGGSAIPLDLRRSMIENLTEQLYVRYAATEFGGISMAGPGMHRRHGCAGRPLPGVFVEVVGEHGQKLPAGEIGLIRLRADGAARGYVFSEDSSASANKFKDGFFYPGDVGAFDEDGNLIVEGRNDEMMIMNGLNIYPDEVQAALESINGIAQAACFPVDSELHGQIPVAAVVRSYSANLGELEILSIARSKLGLKAPRKIFFVDTMPLNAAGKLDKRRLAQSITRKQA